MGALLYFLDHGTSWSRWHANCIGTKRTWYVELVLSGKYVDKIVRSLMNNSFRPFWCKIIQLPSAVTMTEAPLKKTLFRCLMSSWCSRSLSIVQLVIINNNILKKLVLFFEKNAVMDTWHLAMSSLFVHALKGYPFTIQLSFFNELLDKVTSTRSISPGDLIFFTNGSILIIFTDSS